MIGPQTKELLLQALETEMGGVMVYEAAVRCVVNEDLRKELGEYLEHTRHHEEVVRDVLAELDLDAEEETPTRLILRKKVDGVVAAMEEARKLAPEAAELVAVEGVVEAETKDHLNWQLIGMAAEEAAEGMDRQEAGVLRKAAEEVEDEEDEHLYHSRGWARELWLQYLGLDAKLPPMEEERDVKTALQAARAAASSMGKARAKKAKKETTSRRPTSRKAAKRISRPAHASAARGGRSARSK